MAAAAATARWLNSAHRDIHFVLVPCQHVATMILTTLRADESAKCGDT